MKRLDFSPPLRDYADPFPQKVTLMDASGWVMAEIWGATAPNPQIPGNPDRPNMSEYPIVHHGMYLGKFYKDKHHGKPCISINDDGPVPILQDVNPRHPEQGAIAIAIRVHEAWKGSWRGSAGCMTLEPGGNEFLLKHFTEGEVVAVFIPDQEWFANL